jgi:V/A-type H+-transporting ATPase subunit D
MAVKINPTRMELKRVRERLKTAVRGHKLLKDKSEEMIRQFTILIRKNKKLREEIESELSAALKSFMLAGSLTDSKTLEQAISLPAVKYEITGGSKSIMNVMVPRIEVIKTGDENIFPYSFAGITGELNTSVQSITNLLPKLIELAEVEKSCNMLADEIQKNKRRVNALEYFMIPQMEETIKYIVMKLDENDRANLIRLMKVKELIEKRESGARS